MESADVDAVVLTVDEAATVVLRRPIAQAKPRSPDANELLDVFSRSTAIDIALEPRSDDFRQREGAPVELARPADPCGLPTR